MAPPGAAVSGRARDVAPVSVALFLVAAGALLLADSTGARPLGPAGAIGGVTGLAFVALGTLAVLAAWRVRRFSRRLRRTVGHVRSSDGGWTVGDDAVISTVAGDISLDLQGAELPPGETELALLCWLGTIQVRAPRSVGVDVTAQAIVGSVDVLGRREEGVVRDIHARSDGYGEAERRVKMRLSTFVGELVVVQV